MELTHHGIDTPWNRHTIDLMQHGIDTPWNRHTMESIHHGIDTLWNRHTMELTHHGINTPRNWHIMESTHHGLDTPWNRHTMESTHHGLANWEFLQGNSRRFSLNSKFGCEVRKFKELAWNCRYYQQMQECFPCNMQQVLLLLTHMGVRATFS